MATPKEIELAAKYIVHRFGVTVDPQEDDDEDEEQAPPLPPKVQEGGLQGPPRVYEGGFQGLADHMSDDEVAIRSNPMATSDHDRDQVTPLPYPP